MGRPEYVLKVESTGFAVAVSTKGGEGGSKDWDPSDGRTGLPRTELWDSRGAGSGDGNPAHL